MVDRPKAENKSKTKNGVTCVAWRPKSALLSGLSTGVVVAGYQDFNLRIFATSNGLLLGQMAHPDRVAAVTFSPAGSEVASACADGKVRILDCLTGVMLRELEHNAPLSCISWSPLGSELALKDVNSKLWVQDAISLLGRGNWDAMPPPQEKVPVRTAVALGDSPDDDSDEGEDMLPMPVPLPPKVETGRVCSIAWSSDGAEIGIGTVDGGVQIVDYHKYMTRRVVLPDGTKRRLYPDEVVREFCLASADTQDARSKYGQVLAVAWSPEVLCSPNEKSYKI
jgi:WD40 repeat protein